MIKNKKILVVGAGGFIGGHLVKKLLNDKNKVLASDIKPKEYWFQDFDDSQNYYSMDNMSCHTMPLLDETELLWESEERKTVKKSQWHADKLAELRDTVASQKAKMIASLQNQMPKALASLDPMDENFGEVFLRAQQEWINFGREMQKDLDTLMATGPKWPFRTVTNNLSGAEFQHGIFANETASTVGELIGVG